MTLSVMLRRVAPLAALVLLSACSPSDPEVVPASGPASADAKAAAAKEAASAAPKQLPVLGPAPAWKAQALDGRPIGRDDLKGKIVMLDFWATWCPPCVHKVPGYIQLQDKYRDRGLVIVGLSADQNLDMLKRFLEQRRVNYPVGLLDQETADLFGETNVLLPTTYLIDREGRVRHRQVGAMETADYEKLLAPLL